MVMMQECPMNFKYLPILTLLLLTPKILIAKAWLAKKLMFVSFRQTASP